MDKPMRNDKGFSILEAVIGLFILVLFVLMTNAYLAVFLQTKTSVRQLSRATAVGNDCIEKIRTTAYEEIGGGRDTVDGNFIRTWAIDSAGSDADKKSVWLSVQWPLVTKRHTIHLSTIIAK
jgi:Tfp pilus assembly protein PilV